jgi:hypothetical protein
MVDEPRLRGKTLKKIIVTIAILGVILFTSCTSSAETYKPIVTTDSQTTSTTTETTPSTTPISGSYGDIDITKITEGSFGVYGSLRVNRYVTGVTIDKTIKGYEPIYIINRVNKVSEKKTIGTGVDEVIADIPIRRLLHEGDVVNVLSITSDWVGDNLKAEKYNTDGTITISGFVPDVPIITNPEPPEKNRSVVITYVPDSEYTVTCVYDDDPETGYVQAPPEVVGWVTFDQDKIVIPPDSYAPVWVNLTVPSGTELPAKWMFWIEIGLSSGKQASGVTAQIVYRVGFKVDMR